ncbi:MAG: protein translocase subunit SecF [Patescibacteria group bacterium]
MEYQKSKLNLPIVRLRRVWYTLSLLACGISVLSLAVFGLKFGVDFTGGSLLDLEYSAARPPLESIKEKISQTLSLDALTQPRDDKGLIIRLSEIDEATHQTLLVAFREQAQSIDPNNQIDELRFESFGPSIGDELRRNALTSIGLVMIAIIAYLAYAFRRVSRPVASWKFGTVAVIALAHNVLIVVGLFSLLGHFYGTEVNGLFVSALLTLMGFSVHDTIVTLDRIRENLVVKQEATFTDVVHMSINETFVRSVNTSTVVLVLISIYLFGGDTIRDFSLALALGIIIGTYSSIFVASPLLVTWNLLVKKFKNS